ncbi:MAG: M3 family metallopeptidase [Candidatus Marinimicrobia bacterium]|nr:M3 family metallopeptidase [Candidatus Neomarinimicrobiota bacterium]MCF7828582.1 M3 family metallopeptidase [Candidatus Neomarinimicrobiota bacterium]MCF7880323.1 M3 family metallopeptidase [Candidatus Neomarinimicrobiota bacterium]
MKRLTLIIGIAGVLLVMCSQPQQNPFFVEYNTPFGVPPFSEIEEEHYMPAFEAGIEEQAKEVEAIASSENAPTFANTIEALERSGELLDKVSNVFYNLTSAHTNDEMQDLAKEVAPNLSSHHDNILLNAQLFDRVKTIYDQRESLELTAEQNKLLEEYHKMFVRGGANLNESDKKKLRKINERLSVLSVQFGDNVLKETNKFELVIDDREDLAGLPDGVISAAAEAAEERGNSNKWVFTTHKPSLIPFLQYSERRDLREKMLKAYINRGNHGNDLDNKEIVREMTTLRIERAKLLGFPTHAHYVLADNMAKEPEQVYELIDQIWEPALERAKEEAENLQALIDEEGGDFELQPWDWWYYAEKVKQQKYAVDDEILRPYFQLENVREGAFMVAKKLYGLTFEERNDIPTYHEDVKVYEVKEADGSHVGILFTDYHPRASKRGGAWMNEYRTQEKLDGDIDPIITNVFNFSEPSGGKPALLTFDEVSTLFHEFGHGLHGLLSDVTYPMLAGTNVPRDFVEMPSQIMENWASEPEVMKQYARHYETGEPIPDALIEKIRKARHFNQGFATVEYLAAAYLDMDWHTLTEPVKQSVNEFEKESMDDIGLIDEIVVRYRSPYFQHIFSGGYSSGYYSYIWAEVLDADAFQAFKENGLFDTETATKFRNNILAKGGTDDPMDLYKSFRGREPGIEPLLKRRGLN